MNMKKWTLTLFVACHLCQCQMYIAETSQRMVGHSYSYRAAIRYFVSENQGKVTCKIGLCDNFLGLCVFFSLHIGPCIYIFKGKQIHTEKVICLILVQQGV